MPEEDEVIPQKIQRINVPALDEILGLPFNVLDKGFVRVVDYMGDDSAIVQAARVSYGKGTKKLTEDEGLIRYLMRHAHTTPTEMCEIKFHVKVPMDCWRQWIRHRMASTNEYSTRYSVAIDDKQETPPDQWRLQSAVNKQGSIGVLTEWPDGKPITGWESKTPGEYLTNCERQLHLISTEVYDERLKFGVAKEVARKDLPLSTYTEAYWKIDLHNLLHFLSLRMDKHAQLEIRLFANAIGSIVEKWCPITWQAFNDYHFRRDALLLSARDKAIIRSLGTEEFLSLAGKFGWMETDKNGNLKANRERQECLDKLTALGLDAPLSWGK